MAQATISDRDARSMAEKLAAFTETLDPGEEAAFEVIERHLSVLVPADIITDDAESRAGGDTRQALWYQLVLALRQ
jgi:hypothetical protein